MKILKMILMNLVRINNLVYLISYLNKLIKYKMKSMIRIQKTLKLNRIKPMKIQIQNNQI